MTQEPQPEKPDVSEIPVAEIERLLGAAYAVPPVPKSLRNRIERAVAEQWRTSPEVVAPRPGGLLAAARRLPRSLKVWPVAACVALAALLTVAYRGNAQTSTWTAVVDALCQQKVIQLGEVGDPQVAWFSIPARIFGQRSGNVDRLFDLGQGVVLERGAGESQIRRYRLLHEVAESDREAVALSFLVAGGDRAEELVPGRDLRLVEQSWSSRGDVGKLKVLQVGSAMEDSLRLTLVVDPRTKLPVSCVVSHPEGEPHENVFSYPVYSPEQLTARTFPPNLPIVDDERRFVAAERIRDRHGTGTAASTKSTVGSEHSAVGQELRLTGAASLGWTPIPPSRLADDAVVAEVDAILERLWADQGVAPVGPASDAELLRRIYLDLAGRAPTVSEAREYLSDTAPDRYLRLVDRLLASPDHATHLATVWRTFLLPEGVDLTRFGGTPAFDEWLSARFGKNVPYDHLVRELLLAEGRLSQSGPLLFYSAAKLDADQLAARTARVFLGMRLDCAQCHDDPFEPWTQHDFWSYAAFFARISRPQAALETVSTVMRVRDIDRGEVTMPRSKDPVAPQFLDGTEFEEPPANARRKQLADWLTGPENPYFARAAVNRVWAHMFGRGIVNPVDGFGKRNPPCSPELLDLLAGRLIGSGFTLRQTFRTIARSRAYQLSSGAESDVPRRVELFAQMNVKMLTAEQVYDCITVASNLVGTESRGFSIVRAGNSNRDEFLQQFKSLAGRPTEFQGGIPQALTLMNGALITSATDLAGSGLLKSLEAPFFNDDQRIEVLYLAALSRPPTPHEWTMLRNYVGQREPGTSLRESLADVLWALLNSAEFTMNH